MPKTKDLIGQKFGKWTVIKRGNKKCGRSTWLCQCECGQYNEVYTCHLTTNQSTQCRKCADTVGEKRHNDSGTRFYRIWEGIKNRCSCKKTSHYERYGGRGIKVCDDWNEYKNFKKDMYDSYIEHCKLFGENNTSIDRINSNGNYELNNCRWCTMKEQAKNRKSNSGKNHGLSKRVICITTGKVFDTITEAAKYYDMLPSRSSIGKCCNGSMSSAGRLEDGTKLVWRYYNE